MSKVKGICNGTVFYLDANKPFWPSDWIPPISWKGVIASTEVSFVQITPEAISLDDFNWDGFPDDFNSIRKCIVEAIDEAMKTMD